MDSTTLLAVLVAAAAAIAMLTASPLFIRQVAPRAVAARAKQVPPRAIADAAVKLLSDLQLLTDAQYRHTVLADAANVPHPAIISAVECVVNRTTHTTLRAAIGAVCSQRVSEAATLPVWVRVVVGAARVLSPGMIAVMCLGMLIAGSAQSGVEQMLPFAGALALAFLTCAVVKRVSNRSTIAIEAYENLVFEIVLAAADAVMLSQPKLSLKLTNAADAGGDEATPAPSPTHNLIPFVIEPKEVRGRALNALHASLAATSYRRSA